MEDKNNKLEQFRQVILTNAENSREEILEQAGREKEIAVEKLQADLEERYQRKISDSQSEIHAAAAIEKSKYLNELRQKLLKRRLEYKEIVFAEAKKKLCEFTASPGYKDFLLKKLEKTSKEKFHYEDSVVYLRKEDAGLIPDIKKMTDPSWDVQVSDDFEIGGFLLFNPERGYILVESIDEALLQQESWYYDHSKLSVM